MSGDNWAAPGLPPGIQDVPDTSVVAGSKRKRGVLGMRRKASNRRVRGDTGYLTEVITFASQKKYGDGL